MQTPMIDARAEVASVGVALHLQATELRELKCGDKGFALIPRELIHKVEEPCVLDAGEGVEHVDALNVLP